MNRLEKIRGSWKRLFEVAKKEGWREVYRKIYLTNSMRGDGVYVGQDEYGNKYFESRDSDISLKSRWYEPPAERKQDFNPAVPPEWHAWMHHIVESPPTVRPPPQPQYELKYDPVDLSQMGFKAKYLPPGALVKPTDIKEDTTIRLKRYESWVPPSTESNTGDKKQ